MADTYIGEIRIFAGNFAPKDWALCDGQLLAIAQNTALFSLLGTTYGGNGITNFALPDMRGMAPLQQGTGAGLTERVLGEAGGSQKVTLSVNQIPEHNHIPSAVAVGNASSPTNAVWAGLEPGRGVPAVYGTTEAIQMNPQAIGVAGESMPHNNRQPYLGLNFIIALQGVYPSRP